MANDTAMGKQKGKWTSVKQGPAMPKPATRDEDEDDYEEVTASRSLDLSSALASAPAAGADGQDDEDDIMALMGKKAVKDATLAARSVVGKGKGKAKDSKDVVGGGSWQSMGE